MNNTVKTLLSPFYFYNRMEESQTVTETKEEKHFRKSHLYLDRIKYINQEHTEKITALNQEIEDLKYRNDVLQMALTRKARAYVSKKIEKEERAKKISRITIENFGYLKSGSLQYILGHTEDNKLIIGDLSKDAQLLISGRTGSGKTVTTLNILMSITKSNTPKSLKISLIDPKILTFGDKRVENSPFLNEKPSIGDDKQALKILQDAYKGMMKRYQLMRKHGVKNYKKIGLHAHVIFIDEVFELLEGDNAKEILSLLTRIASLGRAGGVHLVLATQSPRAKTLSGTLKANLCFIGHKMSNSTESNLIGLKEAHQLRGKGDGLREIEGEIVRFQATFLDEELDKSYATLNPSHPTQVTTPKQTPHAPKTDPSRQTLTLGQGDDNSAFIGLMREIIETIDEKGKIKPKSYFFNKRSRENDNKWSKVINCLHREKEILYYKKGVGYFLSVDYSTALNIIGVQG